MVGALEKRYRIMVVVQKFKTSSLNIVVREHLGFGEKWSSEPWGSNRKYMSVTDFLSDPQRWGNHFNQKQRVNVVGVTICRESQERHEMMMMMDGWMTMMNDHELDLSWI